MDNGFHRSNQQSACPEYLLRGICSGFCNVQPKAWWAKQAQTKPPMIEFVARSMCPIEKAVRGQQNRVRTDQPRCNPATLPAENSGIGSLVLRLQLPPHLPNVKNCNMTKLASARQAQPHCGVARDNASVRQYFDTVVSTAIDPVLVVPHVSAKGAKK